MGEKEGRLIDTVKIRIPTNELLWGKSTSVKTQNTNNQIYQLLAFSDMKSSQTFPSNERWAWTSPQPQPVHERQFLMHGLDET